jgi:hypothetical protein
MRAVRSLIVVTALIALWFSSPLRSDGQGTDLPDSTPFANLGVGTIVIVNAELIVPANDGVVYIQNGAITTWLDLNKKAPSCRLSMGDSPVVRKLVPGRKLIVSGTRFTGGVRTLYGDTLIFDDDTTATVGQMQCTGGEHGHMTIGEFKSVLGALFSLVQAPPVVG